MSYPTDPHKVRTDGVEYLGTDQDGCFVYDQFFGVHGWDPNTGDPTSFYFPHQRLARRYDKYNSWQGGFYKDGTFYPNKHQKGFD